MKVRTHTCYGELVSLLPVGPARRSFGVPPGGAFDDLAWRTVQAILDHQVDAAWEFAGDHWEFMVEEAGTLAVAGGGFAVRARGQDERYPGRFRVHRGDVIVCRRVRPGLRIVAGLSGRSLPAARLPAPIPLSNKIRYVPLGLALSFDLEVTNQLNRVGVRLTGMVDGRPGLARSEPATPGLIQVTPDGTVVIHGPDGPTIGGYSRLGVVASADFWRVGQLTPAEQVALTPISLEAAHELRESQNRDFSRLMNQFRLGSGLLE